MTRDTDSNHEEMSSHSMNNECVNKVRNFVHINCELRSLISYLNEHYIFFFSCEILLKIYTFYKCVNLLNLPFTISPKIFSNCRSKYSMLKEC